MSVRIKYNYNIFSVIKKNKIKMNEIIFVKVNNYLSVERTNKSTTQQLNVFPSRGTYRYMLK